MVPPFGQHTADTCTIHSDFQDHLNRERWGEIDDETARNWMKEIDDNHLEDRMRKAAMKACLCHPLFCFHQST